MRISTLTLVPGLVLLALSQSGCAAAWGDSKKITKADAEGIEIQYDSALFSSAGAQIIARNHCAQFDKKAEATNVEMPGLLIGIISETYRCI